MSHARHLSHTPSDRDSDADSGDDFDGGGDGDSVAVVPAPRKARSSKRHDSKQLTLNTHSIGGAHQLAAGLNPLTPTTPLGAERSAGRMRRTSRVADEFGSMASQSPAFGPRQTSISVSSAQRTHDKGGESESLASLRQHHQQQHQQHGRHGSMPLFTGGGVSQTIGVSAAPAETPAKARRSSKLLQPSNAQRKHSVAHKSPNSLGVGGGAGGGGGGKVSAAMMASRVWKNESTLSFEQRVQLAEDPSLWCDPALAASNLVDVWEHYDANRDAILNRGELVALASDVVDRFLSLYRAQIRAERPEMAQLSEPEMVRLVRKDVFPHLLSGTTEAESKRCMVDRLQRALDVDGDGQITRTEFLFHWKITITTLLKTAAKTKSQAISCVIL